MKLPKRVTFDTQWWWQILTNMCHKMFELWCLNSPTSVFVECTECQGYLINGKESVPWLINPHVFNVLLYHIFLTASLSSEAFILWLIMLQNSGNSIWPDPSVSYCRGKSLWWGIAMMMVGAYKLWWSFMCILIQNLYQCVDTNSMDYHGCFKNDDVFGVNQGICSIFDQHIWFPNSNTILSIFEPSS